MMRNSIRLLGATAVLLAILSGIDLFQPGRANGYRGLTSGDASTMRGADPSSSINSKNYTCENSNADAENQFNKGLTYVPWYSCGNVGNGLHPCIKCGKTLNSISVNNDRVTNGYIYKTSVPCDNIPPDGTIGTCVGGNCNNTMEYDCSVFLDAYNQQSGPGG